MPGATVSPQVANEAYAVTTHDTNPNIYSYLFVGVGGDVVVTPEYGGSDVTFKNVPTGSYLWIRTSKVKATSTTATNIIGHK